MLRRLFSTSVRNTAITISNQIGKQEVKRVKVIRADNILPPVPKKRHQQRRHQPLSREEIDHLAKMAKQHAYKN